MSGICLTRFRKASNGPLSKKISLEDGTPVSDGSPCSMCAGTATRVEITRGASGLADLIGDLESCEALGLGNHVAEQDEIDLVLDKHADPARGLYSRTVRFFAFEPGKPAVVLLDFDQKGMPPKVAELLEAMGGFEAAISMLLEGDFGSFARVVRKSTSAGLYNRETGERFPGGGGQHLYLLVQDGSDIPRLLRALQARAWKAELGWIMIGKRGARLIRSIIDVSVGSPERLVFEGAPLVVPPLAQDQEERRPIAHDGDLIDTRIACPDLTEAEETEFKRSVEAAKAELEPEVEKAVEAAAEGLAKKHSISIERARKVIEASTRGELLSWDSVHFDNDALGVVEVADILAEPERYHGETLADPIEGRDYGTGKAKVFYNRGGSVIINSFAHGSSTYKLEHCPEYVALLGANEEVKAPTCTVLGITGNKIEIAGDLTRRMIRVDLDAGCERPETRHFDFDCEAEARRDRAELVVAALTLLKAHALAEWPRVEGRALLGSYEDWDRLVVGAIVFAGGADIIALMERTRSGDPERDGLAEVLTMLVGVGAITGHGMKAGEIIAAVRTRANAVNPLTPQPGDDDAEEWMAIVRRLGKDGVPEPRRLGRFLKKNAGRLVRGMRLAHSFDTDAKVERYYVEQDGQEVRGKRGKRGTPDPNPESCEKNTREGNRNKKDSDSRGYGANPGNHGNPGDEFEGDGPWEAAI